MNVFQKNHWTIFLWKDHHWYFLHINGAGKNYNMHWWNVNKWKVLLFARWCATILEQSERFSVSECSFTWRWIEYRGNAAKPSWFPDLTPLAFYLWGSLKNSLTLCVWVSECACEGNWNVRLNLLVWLLHQQYAYQCGNLLCIIVSNALMQNIWDIKVNFTTD